MAQLNSTSAFATRTQLQGGHALPTIQSTTTNGKVTIASEKIVYDTESEEWRQLILRRGELISKKNRQGLNDEERLEYEQLEKIVDKVMAQNFPPAPGWDAKIAAVESHLAGEPDSQ